MTTATAHKNFAVNALKAISSDAYDAINAANERRNTAIRAARTEWQAAPYCSRAQDAAGLKLDNVLATTIADFNA